MATVSSDGINRRFLAFVADLLREPCVLTIARLFGVANGCRDGGAPGVADANLFHRFPPPSFGEGEKPREEVKKKRNKKEEETSFKVNTLKQI